MLEVEINRREELDFRTNEAYKSLRTNIELCGKDIKVLAITSCTPNEGKSEVSFNLAASLAEAGNSVLFVDADLRKSVIVGRYKVGKAVKGLTNYLSKQSEFKEVLYATNIPHLYTIFAGPVPPNPAELLGGKYFKAMVAAVRKAYDYVIIDTPPLGSVIDSAVVATECDGVAMVISARSISYKFAQRVKNQLEKTECPLLGVILNKVDLSEKSQYGKYYGKYYGAYYGEEYAHE